MPQNVDSLNARVGKTLKEFTDYDRTVDIVSGFESFFNNLDYKNHLIYFDRFPRMPIPHKTPDFTALFNNYGIIFEMTKGIAKGTDDKPLEKKLKQLLKYDTHFEFRCDGQNHRVMPENKDIVLILDHRNSNEAFMRIIQKIEENSEFNFKNNLIFLDYSFIPEDGCYSINKFAGKNNCFRDVSLPENIQLDKRVWFRGKSLQFYPKHFMLQKFKNRFCNDTPPNIYTAVFLWNEILYNYLDADQRNLYQKGSSRIKQDININADQLVKDINTKYIKDGNVHTKWVIGAMRFMEKANMVEFISSRDIVVSYHNLPKPRPSKAHQGGAEALQHDELNELARQIAYKHWSSTQGRKRGKRSSIKLAPPKPKQRQITIYDF